MPDFTAFLIAVGPLALAVTKLVDFIRSFDKNDSWAPGLWIVLAMAAGVGAALLTGSNFANLLEGLSPTVTEHLTGTLGEIVTGLAIGGTASFWHEHLSATSSKQAANLAAAEQLVVTDDSAVPVTEVG